MISYSFIYTLRSTTNIKSMMHPNLDLYGVRLEN